MQRLFELVSLDHPDRCPSRTPSGDGDPDRLAVGQRPIRTAEPKLPVSMKLNEVAAAIRRRSTALQLIQSLTLPSNCERSTLGDEYCQLL